MAQTELKKIGDVVVEEALEISAYCRETVTIKDGETVVLSALLETSSAKYIVCTSGNQCAGIALQAAAPSGADGTGLAMLRGPAVVNRDGIDFGALNTANITNAIAALKALDILVRSSVTETTL
jgi:hypothetical protein